VAQARNKAIVARVARQSQYIKANVSIQELEDFVSRAIDLLTVEQMLPKQLDYAPRLPVRVIDFPFL
jgi:hypothetical protein